MSEYGAGDPADILLVEDNPGDVRLTREAFKEVKLANTIHVVTDGVEAMDFLFQRGDYVDAPRPDVVLLDLNLPKKNGDQVLEEVKSDPDLRAIPVIVLTSSEAGEDVASSYDRHANAYLVKPVDPNEFMDVVRTFERFWLELVALSDDGED